jgi:hypothetical protein
VNYNQIKPKELVDLNITQILLERHRKEEIKIDMKKKNWRKTPNGELQNQKGNITHRLQLGVGALKSQRY